MKWVIAILLLPALLLVGALFLNRPPLLSPPGAMERLRTYFLTNVAETRVDHEFPELRTPVFPGDTDAARAATRRALEGLGWSVVAVDEREIRAEAATPLLRFRDDVTVRFEPVPNGTLLHGRSASRVGRGDLGANARHLRRLYMALGLDR